MTTPSPMDSSLRDPALCRTLLDRLIATLDGRQTRFMEVCGTHTVAIFRSGLRSLLPDCVTHLSGPGCPVCVTHEGEVAAFLELASLEGVIVATFGDLIRVPGPDGRSLKNAAADGARISVVYSPLEALEIARRNPKDTVVFLGIGFETTAPAVAATVLQAHEAGIANFCVFSLHKLVPPVLKALLEDGEVVLDGFLLPGHVSTVLGLEPYGFLADAHGIPGVIGGFEPADILLALCEMADMLKADTPKVVNAYPRAVAADGNPRARAVMEQVFMPEDALWRGMGRIPASGLALRPAYAHMDAAQRFGIVPADVPPKSGCSCADILKGKRTPTECPLFARKCTPATPVGPCMVSTEGSCAAYHKYVHRRHH